jgi:pimeloyl-ACP methyl ester carboxylesterase
MPIDEGLFVDFNGVEQWITLRGRDLSNPVLLMLHGGPGFPTSGLAPMFEAWEDRFTLVQWDQPGGGATHLKNLEKGEGPLTIERYVADGVAVAEWVRGRLGVDKLVLLGNSWGSLLGLTMARRRPDLFSAFVGTSQPASGPRGGRLGYELALEAARGRGDAAAVAALERVGPPPYATLQDFLVRQTYSNPPGLPPSPAEAAAMAGMARFFAPPPPDARYVPRGLPPYDFMQVFLATQAVMFQQVAAWEAEAEGLAFDIPVFVLQGENDINTPVALARELVDRIEAPAKGFEILPGAGHNTLAFPAEVLDFLERWVKTPSPSGSGRFQSPCGDGAGPAGAGFFTCLRVSTAT